MAEENKFPKKRRPRAFNSDVELREKCSQYFAEWESYRRPLTVIGLAVYLDITKSTLHLYETGKYDDSVNEYSDTIIKAKEYIECHKWEKALTGEYKAAVAIFDLKNNHEAVEKIQHVTKDNEAMPATQTTIITEGIIQSVIEKNNAKY